MSVGGHSEDQSAHCSLLRLFLSRELNTFLGFNERPGACTTLQQRHKREEMVMEAVITELNQMRVIEDAG